MTVAEDEAACPNLLYLVAVVSSTETVRPWPIKARGKLFVDRSRAPATPVKLRRGIVTDLASIPKPPGTEPSCEPCTETKSPGLTTEVPVCFVPGYL
jgi:hypothetical protein